MNTPKLSIAGVITLVIPAVIVAFFSTSPSYTFHAADEAAMIVTFKTQTARVRLCNEEELKAFEDKGATRRKHMQRSSKECGSRERVPLTLGIWIDGKEVLKKAVYPTGLRNDGSIYVYEKFLLSKGTHNIKVSTGELRGEKTAYTNTFEEDHPFASREIIVINIDQGSDNLQIRKEIKRNLRNKMRKEQTALPGGKLD